MICFLLVGTAFGCLNILKVNEVFRIRRVIAKRDSSIGNGDSYISQGRIQGRGRGKGGRSSLSYDSDKQNYIYGNYIQPL